MNQETQEQLILNSTYKLDMRSWMFIYPWIVFGLASSFLFYKYLLQVSPSVMVPELMKTFSLTGSSMGNLAAFYFYAYLSMQLPVGLLLDRFSPRRLLTIAIIVCASGALFFGMAHTFSVAAFGRILIGLGGAFSAVGTMKLITLWFPQKRFALISGLMVTIGILGAVGGQAPLAYLVHLVGWRHAMHVCALIGIALAVTFWIVVREARQDPANSSPRTQTKFFASVAAIVKNKQSWLISIYSGLAFAPISAFAGLWGVPYLMNAYHMDHAFIAGLVSLIFIGFAIGCPIAGWLSDKIQRRRPIMVWGTLFSFIALMVILYSSELTTSILAILLFTMGFFSSFYFVSFATMKEINIPIFAGTAIGFINMFNALCGALSEPLIGKLLDLNWNGKIVNGVHVFSNYDYHVALSVLPIGLILALITLIFIKETHCESLSQELGNR